jgi:hypothetical protein
MSLSGLSAASARLRASRTSAHSTAADDWLLSVVKQADIVRPEAPEQFDEAQPGLALKR